MLLLYYNFLPIFDVYALAVESGWETTAGKVEPLILHFVQCVWRVVNVFNTVAEVRREHDGAEFVDVGLADTKFLDEEGVKLLLHGCTT